MTDEWETTAAVLPGALEDTSGPRQAYLIVVGGANVGQSYPVVSPTMVIGRGQGTDLRLNDDGVSRFHCKLHDQAGKIYIEDLGSRNGTYCNGERVLPGMRQLAEGDRLQVGTGVVLRFTYVQEPSTAPVEKVEAQERDPLTGTLGRRYFMDLLEGEIATAVARKSPLSLVLVHIDRYAEIAADRGQDVLDPVTVAVANQIRDNIRRDDLLARIGPGDFALVSLRASPGDTFMFAERLRKSAPLVADVKVTLSLGIAAVHELAVDTAHDLLLAASSALHRARSQGGNRSVLCTPDLVREPRNSAKV